MKILKASWFRHCSDDTPNEASRNGCGDMLYLLTKALISGAIIALASELAKRNPGMGALLVSLPLVSILAMIWLWRDTGDPARIIDHARATFWFVLPTLPMFLVLPWLMVRGLSFWPSLGLSCLLTLALYLATVWILARFGIEL